MPLGNHGNNQIETNFWKGKSVLITGHTGFKGSWLAIWLSQLGAKVFGISLQPATTPNLFTLAGVDRLCASIFCDIRDLVPLRKHIDEIQAEIVFNLAAQPLVRASYRDPVGTFSSNVMGSINLLETLRFQDTLKAVVMITTDKVYRNEEWCWAYRETDPIGGHDPYSASKSACELAVDCYRRSYFQERNISVATARAGNVIGGGDWSEDRLIPDAVRAWEANTVLDIRRPEAIRPWQHVLEPLRGYLLLAEQLYERPEQACAFNFGPHRHDSVTVKELIEQARAVYGFGSVQYGDGTEGPHEADTLALDIAKAQSVLNYNPIWTLDESIQRTMTWYREHYRGKHALELCLRDIEEMTS